MITRQLTALDRAASALCMGTASFGWTMPKAQCFEALDAFVAMGGNFIDTAYGYGSFGGPGCGTSERVIGEWMRARGNRDQIVLATKGGHPLADALTVGRLDEGSLKADLAGSLAALGVDCIDLYWLHRDEVSRPVVEILQTLNRFIEQGKIRAIGASNWTPARLREAQSAAFAHGLTGFSADQPMWSLAFGHEVEDKTLVQMDKTLYAWHSESRMACMPFTSQAKGFFSKLIEGGEAALSPKAKERYLCAHNLEIAEAVKDIMGQSGLSAGAVALAFLTGQTAFPVFPIIGFSSIGQVEALKEAADAALTGAQMDRLMALAGLVK